MFLLLVYSGVEVRLTSDPLLGTRKRMTFVNTAAIAYTKIMRLRPIFCPYAIAVVFTNVMRLRVVAYGTDCSSNNLSQPTTKKKNNSCLSTTRAHPFFELARAGTHPLIFALHHPITPCLPPGFTVP